MAVSNDNLRERIKKIAPELDTSEMDKKVLVATLEKLTSSKEEKPVVLDTDKSPKVKGPQFRGLVGIWTYGGRFEDPNTSVLTQYLTPSSCIVRVDSGRLDATFGAIPHIGSELGMPAFNILPDFTGRFENSDGGLDMQTYMYVTVDGRQLFGVVETRALMIPTAIDRFANIDTQT